MRPSRTRDVPQTLRSGSPVSEEAGGLGVPPFGFKAAARRAGTCRQAARLTRALAAASNAGRAAPAGRRLDQAKSVNTLVVGRAVPSRDRPDTGVPPVVGHDPRYMSETLALRDGGAHRGRSVRRPRWIARPRRSSPAPCGCPTPTGSTTWCSPGPPSCPTRCELASQSVFEKDRRGGVTSDDRIADGLMGGRHRPRRGRDDVGMEDSGRADQHLTGIVARRAQP